MMLWLLSGPPRGLPAGFILLRYSVLFTVETISLLYLLFYLIYMFYEMMH